MVLAQFLEWFVLPTFRELFFSFDVGHFTENQPMSKVVCQQKIPRERIRERVVEVEDFEQFISFD